MTDMQRSTTKTSTLTDILSSSFLLGLCEEEGREKRGLRLVFANKKKRWIFRFEQMIFQKRILEKLIVPTN